MLLTEEELLALKDHLAEQDYEPIQIDEDVHMMVCDVPVWCKELMLEEVESRTGKTLSPIILYARYNAPNVDNQFRIHSDGYILGRKVSYASVFHLTTGDTGTALFTHPVYGDGSDNEIFTEDDGMWTPTEFFPQEENTMAVYKADRFHSRWPHQATDDRFVVVGFYEEVSNGKT